MTAWQPISKTDLMARVAQGVALDVAMQYLTNVLQGGQDLVKIIK
jgi:hypothetical protein